MRPISPTRRNCAFCASCFLVTICSFTATILALFAITLPGDRPSLEFNTGRLPPGLFSLTSSISRLLDLTAVKTSFFSSYQYEYVVAMTSTMSREGIGSHYLIEGLQALFLVRHASYSLIF